MSISASKIKFFETTLLDFFQKVGREHLPWRKKEITAYEVWVSEIMLQQTQVSRVIGYYNRFLKRYPTIESLAKSSWEEFLPYYEGLGYYARGRNMLRAAKMIVTDFQGVFPCEKKLLETIPGIGPYTASAILSFAYGENHIAWDTNVKRVIGRFFFGNKREDFDRALFERRFSLPAKTLNAALMDFGSALCLARPRCEACSLRMKCVYYKESGVQETIRNTKYEIRNTNVDWKESRAIVFLHENHLKYFSANEKKYVPFTLPKGYVSRADIKDWFMKKYNLTVSVRPPHGNVVSNEKRILLVNAQILSGGHPFACFPKSAREEYTEEGIT